MRLRKISCHSLPRRAAWSDAIRPPAQLANSTEPHMHTVPQSVAERGERPHLEPEAWVRAGISRSHAYELMAAGKFPRPVKVGCAFH